MRIDSLYLKDVGPFEEVTIDFPAGTRDDLADVYLLTGENGCGKSTVLYALAALIGTGAEGGRLLGERFRGERAEARLLAATEQRRFQRLVSPGGHITSFEPGATFDLIHTSGGFGLFGTAGALEIYSKAAETLDLAAQVQPSFRWAAFAYSGTRKVKRVHVESPKDPARGPFERALSFEESSDAQELAQWFASQEFKRLKAKNAGRDAQAAALIRGIDAIQEAISSAIGRSVRLVSDVDDNNFRVAIDGAPPLPLAVLPDGLKSILAWVGDLCMRLDRIPWVSDAPLVEREFLLLLDEIDIHLHPAWQRRILPMVARLFPRAQIIASTHSPFVVASAAQDAHIIRFEVKDGCSTLDQRSRGPQIGTSVDAVIADVFGIESRFDIDTEQRLKEFDLARTRLLRGDATDRSEVDRLAHQLAARSEELADIMGLELRQLERQLKTSAAG